VAPELLPELPLELPPLELPLDVLPLMPAVAAPGWVCCPFEPQATPQKLHKRKRLWRRKAERGDKLARFVTSTNEVVSAFAFFSPFLIHESLWAVADMNMMSIPPRLGRQKSK
jgi:hypothetical protein